MGWSLPREKRSKGVESASGSEFGGIERFQLSASRFWLLASSFEPLMVTFFVLAGRGRRPVMTFLRCEGWVSVCGWVGRGEGRSDLKEINACVAANRGGFATLNAEMGVYGD